MWYFLRIGTGNSELKCRKFETRNNELQGTTPGLNVSAHFLHTCFGILEHDLFSPSIFR